MLAATEVLTATARSGWAPGIDLQTLADRSNGVFAIADGFGPTYGGHHYPRSLEPALTALHEVLCGAGASGLSSAIAAAHRIALAMGEQGARAEGVRLSHTAVGITVAVLRESVIHVAQVGMSRLYRKRRDVIELLLLDHSLPSAFLRQYGSESREYLDALDFHRTAVARMLGLVPDVDADYVTEPLEDGDCFLICSGGIWNQPEGDLLVRTLFDAAPEGFGPVVTAACSGLDVAALRFRAAATPTASV